jgi:hypothetical protein
VKRKEKTKEIYVAPKLVVHGNVEKLTRDLRTQGGDALSGSEVVRP